MLAPEPPSRFAYVLATVLAIALGTGWFALHRASAPTAPAPTTPAAGLALPPLVKTTATLEDAERYFATWGGYVIWDNEVGEFAMWSLADRGYTQFFEVRRANGQFTFRRLAQLTRPLIDHGEPAQAPMAFTETLVMHADFYRRNPQFKSKRPSWEASAGPLPNLPPKPPERFARAGQVPAPAAVQRIGEFTAEEVAVITALNTALKRNGQTLDLAKAQELFGIMQLYRVAPPSANASPAEVSDVIARQRRANENILFLASAHLNPPQIALFRAELEHGVKAVEDRSARAAERK